MHYYFYFVKFKKQIDVMFYTIKTIIIIYLMKKKKVKIPLFVNFYRNKLTFPINICPK